MKHHLFRTLFTSLFTVGALLVPLFVSAQTVPTTGLVGHWAFDDGSGTTASDSVGSSPGTVFNGAAWTSGIIGQALSFDGVDDYVGGFSGGLPTGPASFSVWIKPTVVSGTYDIIGRLSNWASAYGYGILINGSNVIGIADGGYSGWSYNLATPISANVWSHVVFTLDGWGASTTGKLYVDGVLKNTFTGTAGQYASYPFNIGSSANGAARLFSGDIDDVRIYNRALSATEVQSLYNAGTGSQPTPTPTPTPTTDTTAPSTPTGLVTAVVSSAQISMSWTASTDNIGVTGYKIYRDGTLVATTNGTFYTDSSLSPSTSYSYTITALDAAGNESAQSSASVSTTYAYVPPSVGSTITTVTIQSTSGSVQTNVPVTFGQVFKAGDVPSASTLTATLSGGTPISLQVDKKATHRDGSLRHAVLTAIIPTLPANGSVTLNLKTTATPLSGAVITAQDLLNSGFDAQITLNVGGTVYTASARNLLQLPNVQNWLSGPLTSEFLVSAPFKDAQGNAHPHLTARFELRAYGKSASQVRVSAIVENNWTWVLNPSNFTYNVTVTVNGTQVYAKNNVTHYHHARWRKIFWAGAQPQVNVQENTSYIISTGAVPNYDPALSPPASYLTTYYNQFLASNHDIMGIGILNPYMPSTGGRPDIGPLPQWAVLYLLTMDPRMFEITEAIGDLGGSWSSHYRDKNTDLPVKLTDYPNLTTHPNVITSPDNPLRTCTNCSTPYTEDPSHQPSMEYVPYLVTGDHYFLEELQFWANQNAFRTGAGYRGGALGLLNWLQVRGQAWSLRTLGETAYITPDANPMKSYFETLLQNNITEYTNRYTGSGVAVNSLGVITDGYSLVYNSGQGLAPWQDDFFTWAIGHIVELGYTQAIPLRNFKAKFTVGRMTDPNYCWIFGSNYTLNVKDLSTGNLYSTFGQVYQNSIGATLQALQCNSQAMATALGTQIGEMVGYSHSPQGYPSNMQPAVAIAADSGIPNSGTAWQTFDSRSVKPYSPQPYNEYPNWDIVPRSTPVSTPPPAPADTTAPSIPTGVTATAQSTSQIALSWTASTDNVAVTGYKVYRGGTLLTTTTNTTYTDTGLSPSTAYSYTIAATDAAGNTSSQSTAASATTQAPADTTPPTISTPTVTTTTTGATITFTTNESATTYVNYGLTTAYGSQTTSKTGTSHAFTISNLSQSTTYNYRVTATDLAGNTTQSVNRTFTTLTAVNPDLTPPAQTTNLTSSNITQTSADLSWTAPGDNGTTGQAASYDVRYSTTPLSALTWNTATMVTGEPTPLMAGQSQSMTLVGLSPSQTYYVALTTTDAAGNTSTLSNVATVTTASPTPVPTPTPAPTPSASSSGGGSGIAAQTGLFDDFTPPAQVGNPTIQGADRQLTLSWTNPTDPDYVRTMIVRKVGSRPTSRLDGEVIYEGTGTEYTDTNLDNTQTYYYSIHTYDKKPNYSVGTVLYLKPQQGKTSIEHVAQQQTSTPATTPAGSTTGTTVSLPRIVGPFKIGDENENVRVLQQYLARDKDIYPEGITSGFYGTLTRKAVERFQIKYGIVSSGTPESTGFGLAGPTTRAKIQEILGGTTEETQTAQPNANLDAIRKQIAELQALVVKLLERLKEVLAQEAGA